MSDHKESSGMLAYYADLYELDGAVLDKASYEKHTASPSQEESTDPFSVPQDFREIAAQAIEADRQFAEASAETPVEEDVITYTTEYIEQPSAAAGCLMHRGSGSYRSSGSYRMSSRRSSGSFRSSSGSYRASSNIILRSCHISAQDLGGYGLHLI